MAELKLKKPADKSNKYGVFELTHKSALNISSIENYIRDHGYENAIPKFDGNTDEDLLRWIEEVIRVCHDDDPNEFIGVWEMDCDELLKFEVKLARAETK